MTDAVPTYQDDIGWARVDAVLKPEAAFALAARCNAVAEGLDDPRSGDKPHGQTRRLTALEERVPEAANLIERLAPVVSQILPDAWTTTEIAFRSPGAGTGGQQLHADDLPRLDAAEPYRSA